MGSKVYFIKASLAEGEQGVSEKARKLFRAGDFARCFSRNDFTAVKIHIGEDGNNTYIKAPCFKGLIDELLALKTKPFLADTSTLYARRRHNAIDHMILAHEHGFDMQGLGIPFIVLDGLFGTSEATVQIDGVLNKEVSVASDIIRCQSILSVAHFTGHIASCLAATLKTLGMGCSSRKGKMRQHSALKPSVRDACVRCGECYKYCPADAITIDDIKAHIDRDKCIGCAECVAVCRFDAVEYDWGAANDNLQKNIAEHAKGVLKDKENKAAFFNFILSVSDECDCMDTPNLRKIVPDVGIVASTDPVAVDKASLDLVESIGGRALANLIQKERLDPHPQLEHAQRIGLGSTKYSLVEVS